MRTNWTDDLFKQRLLEASVFFGRRMPTFSELKSLGMNDLACQITRRGGSSAVAGQLGLDIQQSDSVTGWRGETLLAETLMEKGYLVENVKGVSAPFDLLVNCVVRVDVKSAEYAEYGSCKGWFYRVGKIPTADVMAFVQLDTRDVYLIPWAKCPRTNVTISRDGGIYAEYCNRFSLIKEIWEAMNRFAN